MKVIFGNNMYFEVALLRSMCIVGICKKPFFGLCASVPSLSEKCCRTTSETCRICINVEICY